MIAVASGLGAGAVGADPSYDADLACHDDPVCAAEFVGAAEPPRLGLPGLLTAPNDARRGSRWWPRRSPSLRVAAPRTAPHLPGSFEFGPRVKADVARTAVDLNLGFDRGAAASQAAPASDLKYQWQVRYPLLADIDLGLQGSGEFGSWSQLRPIGEQPNRYGVSLFGLARADGGGLGWHANMSTGSAYGKDGYLFSGSVKYGF